MSDFSKLKERIMKINEESVPPETPCAFTDHEGNYRPFKFCKKPCTKGCKSYIKGLSFEITSKRKVKFK